MFFPTMAWGSSKLGIPLMRAKPRLARPMLSSSPSKPPPSPQAQYRSPSFAHAQGHRSLPRAFRCATMAVKSQVTAEMNRLWGYGAPWPDCGVRSAPGAHAETSSIIASPTLRAMPTAAPLAEPPLMRLGRRDLKLARSLPKILAGLAQYHHAVPDFRIDQQPEPIAVIDSSARMFLQQCLNGCARQDPGAHQLRVLQIPHVELSILILEDVRQRR